MTGAAAVAATAAAAVVVTEAVVATSLCTVMDGTNLTIPPERLAELGPAASARELLHLRRNAGR